MILAPGTNEGGVMVVSTKPRYPADALSLAFEKNYLNPPSKGRVQGVYHQTLCTLVLQGESTGCLSLNTLHPFWSTLHAPLLVLQLRQDCFIFMICIFEYCRNSWSNIWWYCSQIITFYTYNRNVYIFEILTYLLTHENIHYVALWDPVPDNILKNMWLYNIGNDM